MTLEKLQARTRRDLAAMAKNHAVVGWHAMRKDELIAALVRVLPAKRTSSTKQRNGRANTAGRGRNGKKGVAKHPAVKAAPRRTAKRNAAALAALSVAGKTSRGGRTKQNGRQNGTSALPTVSRTHLAAPRSPTSSSRILKPAAVNGSRNGNRHDAVVAEAHDSEWVRIHWSLSQPTIDRAEAALGIEWHQSMPIIRAFDVTKGDNGEASKAWVCDVEIRGDVDNWFVPIENPARTYRFHVGYLAPSGTFFELARSNRIKTPSPGMRTMRNGNKGNGSRSHPNGNGHLALNSLLDTTAPASRPSLSKQVASADGDNRTPDDDFPLEVHAELIVYGATLPDAAMTLLGEPVALASDGSFAVRVALPNGRQIVAVAATTPNGAERRTFVLAVERNTKELERQNLNEPLF